MSVSLALDVGTTSVAGLAIDQAGRIVASAQAANSSGVAGLPQGYAEQAPNQLLSISINVLRRLTEQISGEVVHCLGITGQMHGTVLLDKYQNPISNLVTWQDQRANEIVPGTRNTYLEQYLARCDSNMFEFTGCYLALGYLATTLHVLGSRQQIPSNTRHVAFVTDWIAAKLADIEINTDRSNAAGSGVYDLQNDCWSDELIDSGGLNRRLFPSVRESGEVIGKLSRRIATETGLTVGLPICNAIGDNQASMLGSAAVGNPAIHINVGTGGQISWKITKFIKIEGMETRYLPHRQFMLVGSGSTGGDAYAWLTNVVEGWLQSLGIKMSAEQIYRCMNRLAANQSVENDGLRCEPLFRGTRRQPHASGSFDGILVENFTLGHVAYAVLQGVANGLHWFYQNAGLMKPETIPRIIGSGNGLRKNPLLVQIIARTFERPVFFPDHQEEAAYGAALLAGSMTGLWPDLQSAGEVIRLYRATIE